MPPKSRRKRKAAHAAPTAATKRSRKTNMKAAPKKIIERKEAGSSRKPERKTCVVEEPADTSLNPDAPAYMDTLPDELLLCVLEHLDAQFLMSKQRIKQFQSVCLASRRLNRLSNNFLYEEFDSRIWPHPTKFLRTIIANSDLASRVRTMWWTFEMQDYIMSDTRKPSSTDRRHLRESLKRLQISARTELDDQYSSGEMNHLFKVALLHTPNLRHLIIHDETPSYRHIARNTYQEKSYMQLLSNAAKGTPIGLSPIYSHLHSLNMRVGDMWLEDVLPIFRLPSLRNLVLNGINGIRPLPNSDEVLASYSDVSLVTDLVITDSFLDTKTLVHLVAACRELRKFVFVYSSRVYILPVPKISYSELGKALQKHKKTLEILDLDDVSDRTMPAITEYNRGVLGSLQEFKKLVYLGTPIEAFECINDPPMDIAEELEDPDDYIPFARLGQILPKSLLHLALTIFEDEEHSDFCSESLRILHKSYQSDLPLLHDIEVKAHKLVYMKSIDLWIPKHKFIQSGIAFTVSQDGVLEEDLPYSSDEDTISDSELYDSFDDFMDWAAAEEDPNLGVPDEFFEGDPDLGIPDEFIDNDPMGLGVDVDEDDDIDGIGDHTLETLLDVMDGIQEANAGVNAAMASVVPLLASLQAGHLHHYQHHHHHHHH